MFLRILNYGIKSFIIIFGILIISGVILDELDTQMRIVFGAVFILFGLYRLTMYYTREKRYKFMNEEEDEEN